LAHGLKPILTSLLVYKYLVGSLCTASLLLRDERNAKYFHVDGYVYLLHV